MDPQRSSSTTPSACCRLVNNNMREQGVSLRSSTLTRAGGERVGREPGGAGLSSRVSERQDEPRHRSGLAGEEDFSRRIAASSSDTGRPERSASYPLPISLASNTCSGEGINSNSRKDVRKEALMVLSQSGVTVRGNQSTVSTVPSYRTVAETEGVLQTAGTASSKNEASPGTTRERRRSGDKKLGDDERRELVALLLQEACGCTMRKQRTPHQRKLLRNNRCRCHPKSSSLFGRLVKKQHPELMLCSMSISGNECRLVMNLVSTTSFGPSLRRLSLAGNPLCSMTATRDSQIGEARDGRLCSTDSDDGSERSRSTEKASFTNLLFFRSLPSLQTLDLSRCRLSRLPDSWNLPQLLCLNLSYNAIADFPNDTILKGLPLLKELNMYGNKISQLPLPPSPSGGRDFYQCDSTDLKASLQMQVEPLSSMEVLNLGYNDLAFLPEIMDKLFPSLKTLILAYNCLDRVSERIVLGSSRKNSSGAPKKYLKELDVTGNPIVMPPIQVCERGVNCMRRYYSRQKALRHALLGKDRSLDATQYCTYSSSSTGSAYR